MPQFLSPSPSFVVFFRKKSCSLTYFFQVITTLPEEGRDCVQLCCLMFVCVRIWVRLSSAQSSSFLFCRAFCLVAYEIGSFDAFKSIGAVLKTLSDSGKMPAGAVNFHLWLSNLLLFVCIRRF